MELPPEKQVRSKCPAILYSLNDEGKPLGPSYAFNEDVSKYIQFLQNGLTQFKKEEK